MLHGIVRGERHIMRSHAVLRASASTLRTLHTTTRLRDTATATPARKPVGAFRGGMLGFFAGSTLAGAGVYFYILDEYRIANQVLNEDIHVSLLEPSVCAFGEGRDQTATEMEKRIEEEETEGRF